MALDLKKKYADRIEHAYGANVTVTPDMYNTAYTGDVNFGSVVVYESASAGAVDHTTNTLSQTATDTSKTITVSVKDTNVPVDGAQEDAIPANIEQARFDQAVADQARAFDLVFYSGLAADTGSVDLALSGETTAANVEARLIQVGEAMNTNGVPMENRWLTVSPKIMTAIQTSSIKDSLTPVASDIVTNGIVYMLYGFKVKVSNQLGTIDPNLEFIAGHSDAVAADNKIPFIQAVNAADKVNTVYVQSQGRCFAGVAKSKGVVYNIFTVVTP